MDYRDPRNPYGYFPPPPGQPLVGASAPPPQAPTMTGYGGGPQMQPPPITPGLSSTSFRGLARSVTSKVASNIKTMTKDGALASNIKTMARDRALAAVNNPLLNQVMNFSQQSQSQPPPQQQQQSPQPQPQPQQYNHYQQPQPQPQQYDNYQQQQQPQNYGNYQQQQQQQQQYYYPSDQQSQHHPPTGSQGSPGPQPFGTQAVQLQYPPSGLHAPPNDPAASSQETWKAQSTYPDPYSHPQHHLVQQQSYYSPPQEPNNQHAAAPVVKRKPVSTSSPQNPPESNTGVMNDTKPTPSPASHQSPDADVGVNRKPVLGGSNQDYYNTTGPQQGQPVHSNGQLLYGQYPQSTNSPVVASPASPLHVDTQHHFAASTVPGHPSLGHGQPQYQPAYTSPPPVGDHTQNIVPRYTLPIEPRYTLPIEPRYSHPPEPRYTLPIEPRYTQPIEPRYTQPIERPHAALESGKADHLHDNTQGFQHNSLYQSNPVAGGNVPPNTQVLLPNFGGQPQPTIGVSAAPEIHNSLAPSMLSPHQGQPAESQPARGSRRTSVLGVLNNVISSLNNLQVQDVGAKVDSHMKHPVQNQNWIDDDAWRRPPLTFATNGQSNPVIWDCPGSVRDTPFETGWYHPIDVPDFLICTRCHDRFIARTNLSNAFELSLKPSGRCRFNVPRITKVLLPQCQATGDLQPLKDYFIRRLAMTDCAGPQGVKGSSKTKWFIIDRDTNDIMVNFVSCEACYEGFVLASPLYNKEFIPRDTRYSDKPQGENDTWVCDMSLGYIYRSFNVFSRNNMPFMEWVDKATKRFQLPKCEGKVVESASRQWVRPRQHVEGLVICEVCYFDQVPWTPLEAEFEYITTGYTKTGSEWMDQALGYREGAPTAWTCDAKVDSVLEALIAAVKRQDIGIFCKAAKAILQSPSCTPQGISKGKWYNFIGGCDEYGICQACFSGVFEPYDMARFLEEASISGSETNYLCRFNSSSARYMQFALKLNEASLVGNWSIYEGFVRKYISIPVCARDEHVPDRRWYGWHDCLICPECYQDVCFEDDNSNASIENSMTTRGDPTASAPTKVNRAPDSLVSKMEVQNEQIKDLRMCCMYSPRMRQKYAEARAKNDVSELLEFSRRRHEVYARTVPQIKMLRAMQEMQMMNAMSLGMAGLMYQGASSIDTISGNTDGYLHGNTQIGWHETENGAKSAESFQQMNNGFAMAGSSGTWMQIFQLAAEWDTVQ
ncbi:hypothetical protein B0I35DRAFT_112921 [Stachybotrys elegans]|uniref:Integral membrane protein n=1 Tax=Stachybotrys elegans TaxID=80388 RepID=A0A8K0SG83_9HYPO|nr:hypothetical protein B0I35DRAFT_112921 [Stachybotrys elegans]